MHFILLSGGSGKRLWPLSNDIRAKQFLKLLPHHSGAESMAQRIIRQISESGVSLLCKSITVAAAEIQKEILNLQLGTEINVLAEPERRDTFPAISLACSYLSSEKNIDDEEVVLIMPVDSYVNNDYFSQLARIEEELLTSNTDLFLVGTVPVFPSEKYGYIKTDVSSGEYQSSRSVKVNGFKEKPDKPDAEKLIQEGALWNCGVFGFQLRFIRKLFEKYPDIEFRYQDVLEHFSKLPKRSFDYEVVEKTENIRAIVYPGPWKDLGTWETLTDEMKENCIGNVIQTSCHDIHVINELDIPIVTMGLENAVVAASPDGILVTAKKESWKLKTVVETITHRPRHEERRWGEYIILDLNTEHDCHCLTKKLFIKSGRQISYQYHLKRREIWTILRGKGILYFEGKKREVNSGDVIEIKAQEKHGIHAIEKLELIEVQIGVELSEGDIVRLELNWDPETA